MTAESAISALGRVVVLVSDVDAAIDFYQSALGFRVLHDHLADGLRSVHIGVPGQDAVGLWLMPVTSEGDRALVGKQAGGYPLLVLYTDDLPAVQGRLHRLQVRTWDERRDAESCSLHLADLHGNVIVVVQLRNS